MTPQPHDARRLLLRLLGPAGPELTCEQCFEQLDHYVELQRARADADDRVPGMRAHLVGCPACAEDHASLHAFLTDPLSGGDRVKGRHDGDAGHPPAPGPSDASV
ncbi:hypothetical protein [Actinomycetospora sp. CA-053990]|jgi:hypothetical protein|uniref:hypothetical protein n=1 Tax=Actinomycetospora sp. CA-053990 TaxID=3239891 RepID=UPI003D94BC2E